jgi:hypothetical protein
MRGITFCTVAFTAGAVIGIAQCALERAGAEVLCYPVIPDTVKCKQLHETVDHGEWTLHLAPGVHLDPRPAFPVKDWRPELREVEPGYLGPDTKPYTPEK